VTKFEMELSRTMVTRVANWKGRREEGRKKWYCLYLTLTYLGDGGGGGFCRWNLKWNIPAMIIPSRSPLGLKKVNSKAVSHMLSEWHIAFAYCLSA
jgi:hypothetical protein